MQTGLGGLLRHHGSLSNPRLVLPFTLTDKLNDAWSQDMAGCISICIMAQDRAMCNMQKGTLSCTVYTAMRGYTKHLWRIWGRQGMGNAAIGRLARYITN